MILVGCHKETNKLIPSYSSNGSQKDIYTKVRSIVEKKDFSVVYFKWGEADNGWYKILTLTDDRWEKIEIRTGVAEGDSTEIVLKDIIITKQLEENEGKYLIDKLVQYHLFEIDEEEVILDKCKQSLKTEKLPFVIADASTTYFQIISGDKVRSLSYYDSYDRQSQCSSIKEWECILKIEKLFEEKWYINKH
ncbi:hypothetical protein [Ohtaekwangia koreensis]|nr:hypothetical protein [Ohtaekwangia koreensis]